MAKREDKNNDISYIDHTDIMSIITSRYKTKHKKIQTTNDKVRNFMKTL